MADQRDVAEQLLDLAREDLTAAKTLNEAEGVSASKSGFNAQQTVEKALKAVLAGRGEDFPFTHDIALLIELCEDQGFQLPDDLREADRLTPYAAALRYGMGNPAAVSSDEAMKWAALAIEWAIERRRAVGVKDAQVKAVEVHAVSSPVASQQVQTVRRSARRGGACAA